MSCTDGVFGKDNGQDPVEYERVLLEWLAVPVRAQAA